MGIGLVFQGECTVGQKGEATELQVSGWSGMELGLTKHICVGHTHYIRLPLVLADSSQQPSRPHIYHGSDFVLGDWCIGLSLSSPARLV
jgi:hypothetical protein